jgi:tRNA (cmo5U34)-methyltransferase
LAFHRCRSLAADDGYRHHRAGLLGRTDIHLGYVDDLPAAVRFHAATLIGVLHQSAGRAAKLDILRAIAARLKPGAPLILAGNRYAYASQPMLLAAWGERWRMQGAGPPVSEEAVADLLAAGGFGQPTWLFSNLFWGTCLARRTDAA